MKETVNADEDHADEDHVDYLATNLRPSRSLEELVAALDVTADALRP